MFSFKVLLLKTQNLEMCDRRKWNCMHGTHDLDLQKFSSLRIILGEHAGKNKVIHPCCINFKLRFFHTRWHPKKILKILSWNEICWSILQNGSLNWPWNTKPAPPKRDRRVFYLRSFKNTSHNIFCRYLSFIGWLYEFCSILQAILIFLSVCIKLLLRLEAEFEEILKKKCRSQLFTIIH